MTETAIADGQAVTFIGQPVHVAESQACPPKFSRSDDAALLARLQSIDIKVRSIDGNYDAAAVKRIEALERKHGLHPRPGCKHVETKALIAAELGVSQNKVELLRAVLVSGNLRLIEAVASGRMTARSAAIEARFASAVVNDDAKRKAVLALVAPASVRSKQPVKSGLEKLVGIEGSAEKALVRADIVQQVSSEFPAITASRRRVCVTLPGASWYTEKLLARAAELYSRSFAKTLIFRGIEADCAVALEALKYRPAQATLTLCDAATYVEHKPGFTDAAGICYLSIQAAAKLEIPFWVWLDYCQPYSDAGLDTFVKATRYMRAGLAYVTFARYTRASGGIAGVLKHSAHAVAGSASARREHTTPEDTTPEDTDQHDKCLRRVVLSALQADVSDRIVLPVYDVIYRGSTGSTHMVTLGYKFVAPTEDIDSATDTTGVIVENRAAVNAAFRARTSNALARVERLMHDGNRDWVFEASTPIKHAGRAVLGK